MCKTACRRFLHLHIDHRPPTPFANQAGDLAEVKAWGRGRGGEGGEASCEREAVTLVVIVNCHRGKHLAGYTTPVHCAHS